MTKLRYFIRSAFLGLRSSPFVHFAAVLTLGLALFAASLARTGHLLVTRALAAWGAEVELTLYLADGLSGEEVEALAKTVRHEAGGEVAFVSAQAALARLSQELGPKAAALDGLPRNPLPASFEVALPPSARDRAFELAQRLQKLSGVTHVDYGREWVERLSRLRRGLTRASLLALSLLGLSAVTVVACTLQLAVYARRDEIEIEKLVGATDSFVKAPFLIEGAVQGTLAASLAAAGLWGLDRAFGSALRGWLAGALPEVGRVALVAPERLVEILAAGVLAGLLGSFVAVGRFLRV